MDRPLRSDAVEGDISMLIYTAMIDPPREKRKFERLYHRYSRAMYAAAYSILQDPHRAEILLVLSTVIFFRISF